MPAAALPGSYRQHMYLQGKDHGAGAGLRPQKAPEKKISLDRSQRQNAPDLSRAMNCEPAQIDMTAFGKRLGEIITKAVRTKAVRASPKRNKS